MRENCPQNSMIKKCYGTSENKSSLLLQRALWGGLIVDLEKGIFGIYYNTKNNCSAVQSKVLKRFVES